jgi:hypothetical protein
MAAPNLLSPTTITGKTAVIAVGTSETNVVENAAASGKVMKINSLIISNVDGTNAADITVDVYRSTTAYKLCSTVAVPADASLVVITKESPIYLEEGDTLRATASAASDLEAICSYEEIE